MDKEYQIRRSTFFIETFNFFEAVYCAQIISSPFWEFVGDLCDNSNEEQRFMYRIDQSHLAVFCIVTIWRSRSPVRIIAKVQWFMYQNRLEPSSSI